MVVLISATPATLIKLKVRIIELRLHVPLCSSDNSIVRTYDEVPVRCKRHVVYRNTVMDSDKKNLPMLNLRYKDFRLK